MASVNKGKAMRTKPKVPVVINNASKKHGLSSMIYLTNSKTMYAMEPKRHSLTKKATSSTVNIHFCFVIGIFISARSTSEVDELPLTLVCT
ncbi:MAG: hypothetical protein R3A45_10590 [Bdellovibrionota bacterium]